MEIRIDGEGRVLLPAALIQELGWSPGAALEVERIENGLRLRAKAGSAATQQPSPHGSATPAGVNTATLKEEARRLADAMRNIAAASEPVAAAPGSAQSVETTSHHLITLQGRTPQIPASCYVAPSAFISGDVTLGEECSIWPGASLRGDLNRIEIGASSNVQDGAVIHVNHGEHAAVIGSGVTVGHQAMLHGCRVEDDALIGIHAVVLDGARLGKGCMIGAGAVVPPGMEVPPGKLVLGVPGKVVRDLTPAQIDGNRENAAEYVRLRGEYLASQAGSTRFAGTRSGDQTFGRSGSDESEPVFVGPDGVPAKRVEPARTPVPLTPVYRCHRVRTPVEIDGALDEAAWMVAEPASAFILSDGSGPPRFPTEAHLCWDEANLYIAFSCQDTDIWGTYTQRDEPLYDEEVVEIFLCPTGNLQHYFEFEISPRNTVFDAKVFSPELDRRTLLLDKEWNAAGMRTAVRVAGTLGRRDDHDLGWIAEIAIPFADLGLAGPPAPNEQWRMNLFRIERGEVEEFSAWSPTLKSPPDYHVPSRFGTLVFVDE
jgi:carbonic anhydrase/acetyltransferase-like protein (isoleucine patch superfamily)